MKSNIPITLTTLLAITAAAPLDTEGPWHPPEALLYTSATTTSVPTAPGPSLANTSSTTCTDSDTTTATATSTFATYHPSGTGINYCPGGTGYPYATGTGGIYPYATGTAGTGYPYGCQPTGYYPTGTAYPTYAHATGAAPGSKPTYVPCGDNGAVVCNGPRWYGICNWGRVNFNKPVGPGLKCEDGMLRRE